MNEVGHDSGVSARSAGAVGAAVLAGVIGLTVGAPTGAGAGALPEPPPAPPGAVLRVEPAAAVAGEEFTVTATGCTAEGVPQDELAVVWVHDWDMLGGSLPTDAQGTATFTGTADASYVPELRLGASCQQTTAPLEEATLFRYETVALRVLAPPAEPTPSTSPAPTGELAAPRFTG